MSDPDSDAEAQAMAEAMGFSSFGAAPAKKKRKFNPVTDSFVEGDAMEKIDRGGKKGKGSGGNMIPLGKQRVIGAGKKVEEMKRNEDEIVLDDDEDDDEDGAAGGVSLVPERIARAKSPRREEEIDQEEDGPQYMDTSEAPPIEADPRDGPAYMDTSLPPPKSNTADPIPQVDDAEAAEMQARIDSILASIQPPPSESVPLFPPQPGPPGLPTYPQYPPNSNLPARPMFPPPGVVQAGEGRGQWSDTASVASSHLSRNKGRGERNPEWYIDYYDPNFNENPWARLEKENGLESIGTWVERPRRQDV